MGYVWPLRILGRFINNDRNLNAQGYLACFVPEDCGLVLMRICVVQIDWALQGYTRDLVNGLLSAGNEVFFVVNRRSLQNYIDTKTINCAVSIIEDGGPIRSQVQNYRVRLASVIRFQRRIVSNFTSTVCLQEFEKNGGADLIIGIEKAGLDMASILGDKFNVPYVYYSLELYIEDHYALRRFEWQLYREREAHTKACATIIQDGFRWTVLSKANRPTSQDVFFLPVGLDKASVAMFEPHKGVLSRVVDVNKLLYFGNISRDRFSLDLFNVVNMLPDGVCIHLHGPLTDKALASVFSQDVGPNKFIYTTTRLPESEVLDLIAGAKIGLAFYRSDNANDLLTAYSSQKIAIYFERGLPIVAFRSAAYEDLFSRFTCGVMIDSMDQLPGAVDKILSSYEEYSAGALLAFDRVYELGRYWLPLTHFLCQFVE